MFGNVGGKIKKLAQIVCWVGIVAYVISGIVIMAKTTVLSGILTAAIGSIVSWVSSLVLYGFGQLVENSDSMVYYVNKSVKSSNTETAPAKQTGQVTGQFLSKIAKNREQGITNPTDGWYCKACGTKNATNSLLCKDCGKYR